MDRRCAVNAMALTTALLLRPMAAGAAEQGAVMVVPGSCGVVRVAGADTSCPPRAMLSVTSLPSGLSYVGMTLADGRALAFVGMRDGQAAGRQSMLRLERIRVGTGMDRSATPVQGTCRISGAGDRSVQAVSCEAVDEWGRPSSLEFKSAS